MHNNIVDNACNRADLLHSVMLELDELNGVCVYVCVCAISVSKGKDSVFIMVILIIIVHAQFRIISLITEISSSRGTTCIDCPTVHGESELL